MSDIRFLVDITTSLEYKGRNAVGIVRTEREIAKAFLATDCSVDFFYFDKTHSALMAIPRQEAEAILGQPSESIDKSAQARLQLAKITNSQDLTNTQNLQYFLDYVQDSLKQQAKPSAQSVALLSGEEEFEFFGGDVLISAGLLWDGNFLERIYALKQRVKLFLIQVVYDIVPVLMPEFCVPGMNVRFPKYILDVAWTADAVYCISNSTMNDMDSYLRKHRLPMPSLHRMELGDDINNKDYQKASTLSNTLEANNFILYVSTIEPRKNHIMLFHVWRSLYQTDIDVMVPLIIVGRHGWNSSDLITMMHSAEHLYPEHIRIMTEVSDSDLDWLYRNSRFTVYPSLYEGWGLPVAESLARGKFCVASNASSIPEVAAGFAELIDPLDLTTWTQRIRHYLKAPEEVQAKEERIRKEYKPVSWSTVMERFVTSVTDLVENRLVSPPAMTSGEDR